MFIWCMNKIQIIDSSNHVFPYLVSRRIISYCKTSTQQNENKFVKEKVLLLLLKKSGGAGGKLLPPWALYYWRPFYKLSQVSQKRIPMGLLISELMSFIYSQFKLKKNY